MSPSNPSTPSSESRESNTPRETSDLRSIPGAHPVKLAGTAGMILGSILALGTQGIPEITGYFLFLASLVGFVFGNFFE